jgi:hypothetical protein
MRTRSSPRVRRSRCRAGRGAGRAARDGPPGWAITAQTSQRTPSASTSSRCATQEALRTRGAHRAIRTASTCCAARIAGMLTRAS